MQYHIKTGKAIVSGNGLRCAGPRKHPRGVDDSSLCGKLIAKKAPNGQLAGAFKCERCNQSIDVEMSE